MLASPSPSMILKFDLPLANSFQQIQLVIRAKA